MATSPKVVAELAVEFERIEREHGRTQRTLDLIAATIRRYGPEAALDTLALTRAGADQGGAR